MGKRAQRIPSWPGVIHSNKGRIHLRRPTRDILTFRLRRSGGPYIPVAPARRLEQTNPGTIALMPEAENKSPLEKSLPSSCYLTDEFFARERELIFCREWFLAGRQEQLRNPGDYLVLNVAGESG